MKLFRVQWQFADILGSAQTSEVVARDAKHAKDRIWMNHVQPSQLRHQIRFISVKEIDPQEKAPAT